MTGEYKIRVKNSRNNYIFNLKRNITVLCGDSGRGKTTLYEMISDYNVYLLKANQIFFQSLLNMTVQIL